MKRLLRTKIMTNLVCMCLLCEQVYFDNTDTMYVHITFYVNRPQIISTHPPTEANCYFALRHFKLCDGE